MDNNIDLNWILQRMWEMRARQRQSLYWVWLILRSFLRTFHFSELCHNNWCWWNILSPPPVLTTLFFTLTLNLCNTLGLIHVRALLKLFKHHFYVLLIVFFQRKPQHFFFFKSMTFTQWECSTYSTCSVNITFFT